MNVTKNVGSLDEYPIHSCLRIHLNKDTLTTLPEFQWGSFLHPNRHTFCWENWAGPGVGLVRFIIEPLDLCSQLVFFPESCACWRMSEYVWSSFFYRSWLQTDWPSRFSTVQLGYKKPGWPSDYYTVYDPSTRTLQLWKHCSCETSKPQKNTTKI